MGIVVYLLQMGKLSFRKTLALDNICKMMEITVGHPKMLSRVWKLGGLGWGGHCLRREVPRTLKHFAGAWLMRCSQYMFPSLLETRDSQPRH